MIITTPALAVKINALASPKFTHTVSSSSSLADGVVIAIALRGIAMGYDGSVDLEMSTEAVLHFDSSAPLLIVDGAGVAASLTF